MEALISVAVLACALVPVLTLSSSTLVKTHFSEYHAFAQARAIRIISKLAMVQFDALEGQFANAGGILQGAGLGIADPPLPAEYARKLVSYREACRYERMGDGIGVLTVAISWTFPAITGARDLTQNRYELQRVVIRPEVGLMTYDRTRL